MRKSFKAYKVQKMSDNREIKLSEEIKKLAATFFGRESNNTSLITITDCKLTPDFKRATIFMTVMPATREATALDFAQRQKGELRSYIQAHSKLPRLPYLEILIDEGEKNRQKIDDLLKG